MKGFGSDNHSGVHPKLLKAFIDCNLDHEPSYGTDQYTFKATRLFKDHFNENCEIHFVYNGTAANVLCLRAGLQRHESVIASIVSHRHVDECCAPELFAGKGIPISHVNGKISASEIEKYLIRKGDQHYSQPKMVSITQPTELGTCYTLSEIQDISSLCKKHNLYFHIDGARLCNAIYFLKTNFKEMIVNLGVDLVSFGGTKNGLAFGEAVLILNPLLKNQMKYIKKQSAQLPSKSRFIANQFAAFLENNLFFEIAQHSVNMASYLHEELQKISNEFQSLEITQPQQSNAVFIKIPQKMIKKLREKYFFYVWDESQFECRLMTSWDTHPDDINGFIQLIKTFDHI